MISVLWLGYSSEHSPTLPCVMDCVEELPKKRRKNVILDVKRVIDRRIDTVTHFDEPLVEREISHTGDCRTMNFISQ